MVSVYRPTRRVRTMDRMLQERAARAAAVRSGRRAVQQPTYTFADSQRIATANGLITQAARAGYPNTGFLPYGTQHYPAMEQVEPGKVPLQPVGATGTQIFAGIIAEDAEYNPDFYWRDKIDIYEKMRRNDGQVKAVERAIFQPIKSTNWYIKPASDSPRDKEIAALVESCLFHDMVYKTTEGRLLRQSWQQVLHHILLFLPMGFSVLAKWFYMDGEDYAKWARWEPLMQKTIWRWWVGADTELVGIQQRSFLDYQIQFLDIAIERLLVFIHEQEGNNFDGTSILRSAYKHWYFKENFYKLQAITVERTATLPPIATLAPEVQSPGMADAVMTQLQNMRVSEAMGITVPAGVAIEFPRNYQRGESEADRAIEHHDAQIARSVLADFLNLGTGSNTGSYSLADVKADLFIQCEEGHCKALENVINTDAIPELVNYNYDGVDVYPELVHKPIQKIDLQQVAALFQANALVQDPELQDFIRNLIGAPLAPRNVVQATNPTSPASPPEGGTQAPMQQGHTADDTSGDGMRPEAGAPAAAMAESVADLHETARLFAEAAAAISGTDVVERGLLFYNPNHDPHNGEFTTGGAGGAGEGASGGRSRGGGRGTRAAKGEHGGGASHSGSSKMLPSDHTDLKKAKSVTQLKTLRSKTEENIAKSHNYLKTVGHDTFVHGTIERGNEKKAAIDAKLEALKAKHEKDGLLVTYEGKVGHASPQHKFEIVHPDGHITHEYENAKETPSSTEAKQHILDRLGYHPATIKAERAAAAKATRTATTTRTRSSGGTRGAKAGKAESVHERAARLQREGGLRPETQPVKSGDELKVEGPQRNVGTEEGIINPAAPRASQMLDIYGEHNLGARLALYRNPARVKEIAEREGVPAGRTRAETISRITAHLTNGRYSANFPKEQKVATAEKTVREPKAAKSTRGTKPAKAKAKASVQDELKPIRQVDYIRNPAAAPDAHFLARLYGGSQLHAALSRYPMSRLRETAANLGVTVGRSKAATIANIVTHMRTHHPDEMSDTP